MAAMDSPILEELQDLPKIPGVVVTKFLASVRRIFDDDLRSVVLYGSGAEGRLRATSDVNLLIVLSAFNSAHATELQSPFTSAASAANLKAMFLLESEVGPALELFAEKFSDILRRRRVLFGPDPFAGVTISRTAEIWRLKQVLLNLTLRLREAYVEHGSAPERVSRLIADFAGPIRSCAATLFQLEGRAAMPPKEALGEFVSSLQGNWEDVLAHISETRERVRLSPDIAEATMFRLIELTTLLRMRIEALR
jgi:hypothetical protein